MTRRLAAVLLAFAFWSSMGLSLASAAPAFANNAFQRTWARTDNPVAAGEVVRTWMWGPGPDTGALMESYTEGPGGSRVVQYFDKTRMEDNAYRATDPWDVTNGLLAEELLTGKMQLGDATFEQHAPAQVNVAGDGNDPNGPTYASFNGLMSYGATPAGWVITQTVNRAGTVGNDASTAGYNVTAQDVGAPTQHTVASVFWDFMNSQGLTSVNATSAIAPLFPNPFYATGYPLTEPYWATVLVGGAPKQVLVQVFERRVLTFTPGNPAGWQVEAGNVGLHYYQWRYGQALTPPTTPPTTQPPTTQPPTTVNHNCSDFASQLDAQNYFNSHGGSPSNNVEGLDSDHDGIACEDNPAPYSQEWEAQHGSTVTQPPPSSGATALCKDGTYSYSQHASGTCSGHGGVADWINHPSS